MKITESMTATSLMRFLGRVHEALESGNPHAQLQMVEEIEQRITDVAEAAREESQIRHGNQKLDLPGRLAELANGFDKLGRWEAENLAGSLRQASGRLLDSDDEIIEAVVTDLRQAARRLS